MYTFEAKTVVNYFGKEVDTFVKLILPPRVSPRITIKFGGGSYTDQHVIQLGLFEFFVNDEEEIGQQTYTMAHGVHSLKAVGAHEAGHLWFSNWERMKEFIEKVSGELEKEGIKIELARKVVQHFFNCTEDGRMEKRMVNMFPGLINYFRFNNGVCWKMDAEEFDDAENQELNNFLRAVCTYCVVGLRPRWYKNTKGHPIRDNFEKLPDALEKCINAGSCKKNADATYEAIHIVWDYLVELLKRTQEDEQAMKDLMDSIGDSDIQEGTSGTADGSSAGSGSKSARMGGKDSGEGGDKNGSGKGKPGKPMSSKTRKEGDNSGSAHGENDAENPQQAYDGSWDMATEKPDYDYSNISGDGGGSTEVIESDDPFDIPDAPEVELDKILEEASAEAEKNLKPTKEEEEFEFSSMSAEEVYKALEGVGYDKEYIRTYQETRSNYRMLPLDNSLDAVAEEFKQNIEKCFKEKNQVLNKMSSGRLDTRQLHRIGMGEYNIFQKNLNRSLTDAVVEICWDGSGSMHGGKQEYSARACAIIEHGLKGLVPLKIINFTTGYKEVIHYLVKDFDENETDVSYALSYARSKGFSGGNKDGYSIRVCTEDLLRRSEKDKVLIVMSDGLPTDYNSINPADDVKDAVQKARKQGVIVIPIFFGDAGFRRSAAKEYEYMYEKDMLNAAPEELPDRLVELFEALLLN